MHFRPSSKLLLTAAALLAALALVWSQSRPHARADESDSPSPGAVERARREVRLLDDLYKTAIVTMNDTYVEDEGSVAAAVVATQVFDAMRAKGWHDARLVDATGEPVDEDNKPRDDFERAAIEKIKAGETYYDQVVSADGKTWLRAATLVPAVNAKCILCHPNSQVGDVLGAVSYKLPVE